MKVLEHTAAFDLLSGCMSACFPRVGRRLSWLDTYAMAPLHTSVDKLV